MTNPTIPGTDYLTAYHDVINRIDAIEKRLLVKRKRIRNKPTCSFQCPSEMYAQISEIAIGLALTRSDLLRSIVKDYLNQKNKPQGFAKNTIVYEDLEDDGFIDL